MRMSIALATYNGEAFLDEQLNSFAAQKRLPDELVVCDDASSDRTRAMLQAFAARAPFEVRLEANPSKLGCAGNFARAISLCRGDAIFLADQDDVWIDDKLALIERVFLERPSVGMVFGDMHIVDERLRPLGYTGFDALGFRAGPMQSVVAGRAFEALVRWNFISGATMGFRSEFRDVVVPVGAGWVHDEWVALIVAALSDVALIDRPFVLYRQHHQQQIGLRRLDALGQFRRAWRMGAPYMERQVQRTEAARARLLECGRPLLHPDYRDLLDAKLAHARLRRSLRGRWLRAREVLAALRRGDYDRFDYGWKSAAQDLFMP